MLSYFAYIMTNKNNSVFYIGVTSQLEKRNYQHKSKLIDDFPKKYHRTKLVYYEEPSDVLSALAREKQLKGWIRAKKIALIESQNPSWSDLSVDWYRDPSLRSG